MRSSFFAAAMWNEVGEKMQTENRFTRLDCSTRWWLNVSWLLELYSYLLACSRTGTHAVLLNNFCWNVQKDTCLWMRQRERMCGAKGGGEFLFVAFPHYLHIQRKKQHTKKWPRNVNSTGLTAGWDLGCDRMLTEGGTKLQHKFGRSSIVVSRVFCSSVDCR